MRAFSNRSSVYVGIFIRKFRMSKWPAVRPSYDSYTSCVPYMRADSLNWHVFRNLFIGDDYVRWIRSTTKNDFLETFNAVMIALGRSIDLQKSAFCKFIIRSVAIPGYAGTIFAALRNRLAKASRFYRRMRPSIASVTSPDEARP